MENIEKNILQPHQEEAYENTLELLEDKGKAAVIFPTGCGKTFIALQYMIDHPDAKVLFLSPRYAINNQMYEYIIKHVGGDDREIGEIKEEFGSLQEAVKHYAPNFEATLYQSIIKLGESKMVDKVIGKLKPDLIIADEMHHLEVHVKSEDKEVSENIWGKKFDKFLAMNSQAKILGLTATPVKMNGANIVERMFEDAVAEELSLLDAIEAGIIKSPKYVVPDFITEDEKQTLLEKIEIAQGQGKQELKERYDELVEQSDKAQGIPELMEEHVKEKDGRYIIFCKDIKDMEEKMEQSKEWFGRIDEEPEIYGVNYLNNNRENNKILDEFGNSKSEHIKLMYCVGMLDEGVHAKDVSGVILTTKTKSRPAYLQRIGRAISSGKDKKQTLVLDLVNNNEILQNPLRKDEKGYEITDAEALVQLIDWIEEKNNGEIPVYSEENSIKENSMAKRFMRLNNKYFKYAENDELYNELDEYKQEQVDEILMLGEQIGLFDELIEIKDEKVLEDINNVNNFMDGVEIKGVRREFLEIISKRLRNSYLDNALEIENWCKENFEDKEVWERRLPKKNSEEVVERRLGMSLSNIRKYLKQYEGKRIEEIENEDNRKIVEIVGRLDEKYGLSQSLKNALEIEKWCKENFEDKEVWERRLPSESSKNKEEKRLGTALYSIKHNVLKQYEGKKIEEIEDIDNRRIVEIVRNLDIEYGLSQYLKNLLKIEKWCKENFEDKEVWERRLPSCKAKDEEEKKLGAALRTIKVEVLKKYEGKNIEEIEDVEHKRIVEIVKRLEEEYALSSSLKNTLEIENWCKKNFEDKEIWERRLPRQTAKEEYEKRLGGVLSKIRQKILKKYEGKELGEIEDEEYK